MKRKHIGWLLVVLVLLSIAFGAASVQDRTLTSTAFAAVGVIVLAILLDEVAL